MDVSILNPSAVAPTRIALISSRIDMSYPLMFETPNGSRRVPNAVSRVGVDMNWLSGNPGEPRRFPRTIRGKADSGLDGEVGWKGLYLMIETLAHSAVGETDAVDLNDLRHSPEMVAAAIRGTSLIAHRWKLTAQQTGDLMGGMSADQWNRWQTKAPSSLTSEQLIRSSLLLNMFVSLHYLFRGPLADEWMTRHNTNPIFAGRTPLQYMREGGIPAMTKVRDLLDGYRTHG